MGKRAKKKTRKAKRKRTIRTLPRARAKFLAALADLPNVTAACEAAGIGRRTAYDWMDKDAEFKEAVEHAEMLAVSKLEAAGLERARDGVIRRPIFNRAGKKVGVEMEYSDTIWGKMMAAHHPAYRNRHEISGPGGGPIQVEGARERLAARLEALKKRMGE